MMPPETLANLGPAAQVGNDLKLQASAAWLMLVLRHYLQGSLCPSQGARLKSLLDNMEASADFQAEPLDTVFGQAR